MSGKKINSTTAPRVPQAKPSESIYKALVQQAAEALFAHDLDGRFVEVNRQACDLLGYSHEELLQMGISDISPDFDLASARQRWNELEAGKPYCFTTHHRHKDGRSIPVEVRVALLTIDSNKLVMALVSDITERMQTETALRQERDINQLYLNAMQALMVALDGDGKITMINRAALNLLGYTENELLGRNWFEACLPQPAGMAIVYPVFCRLMDGDAASDAEFENVIVCRDGSQRLIVWRNTLLTGEDNRIVGTLSSGMDITERKRTELALQDSEARYRRFAEELPLGIIITQDGLIKYVNNAAIELFGYPEEELLDHPFLPFVCEADRDWLIDLHQRRMQGQKVESLYVIGVIHKNGSVHQWQLHSSTIEWDGKLSALASISDVTERKLDEQQLRIAATIFESQEGMLITDADKVILRVNRAFCNITGYAPEEVIGRCSRMLGSGRQASDFYTEMWKKIDSTGSWAGDAWERRKNSEIFPAHLTITAVKDHNGTLTNYVATYSDITARVSAEEKLLDSLQKLEEKERSKTRFLAAAGHDLRQPIAAATLYLEALKAISQNQQQDDLIERIDHSMNIFSSLLDRLLDISKFDAGLVIPQPRAYHLAELFDWLEKDFSQTTINKPLRLDLFFPSSRQLVLCTDFVLLQSVLMNLISNAIKFTASGRILISARLRGDSVLLQVWDTGIGIDMADTPYIFDEFFQVDNFQRNRDAGLGLGLSICQRTVSLLGSKITCRSRLGLGSVFEFSLPLNDTQALVSQPPANSTESKAANSTFAFGKKFVIVEDDALVADSMVKLLHIIGAEVLYFNNAEDALQGGIANADYFIVDYALGDGLTGIQFLEAVQQQQQAPIRAVILTGETSSGFISSISDFPWPVLHKPITYATLVSGLNQ